MLFLSMHILSQPAQNIGLNITAATVNDVLDPVVIPPNLNGWVGPKQYILICYGIIRSFDKFTGLPDGVLNLDASSFFGVEVNDPRICYSRYLDRWLFACEDTDLNTGLPKNLVFVWSDSGIITAETKWTFHTFANNVVIPQLPTGNIGAIDYNQLMTDANAVYVSFDTFDVTTGFPGVFLGTSLVVIPNSSFQDGNAFNYTVIPGVLPGPDPEVFGEFTPPANNFDSNPEFGYLLNAQNQGLTGYPSGETYTKLYLYRIINPGSDNASLSSEIALDVPTYSDPANAPHKGNLYNSLESGLNVGFLATSFGKINDPHVRNKQLYACHNIQIDNTGTGTPTGDRVGVRWYQFDLTGDSTGQGRNVETATTVPALVQSGTLFDSSLTNPLFYYIPAIMTNKNNDMVIIATASGQNAYTNAVYAGRKAADDPGTLRDVAYITNNNSNPYNFGPLLNTSDANNGQRWGDLQSVVPDPSNDLDIWATSEWAALNNGWGIQTTQLTPAS